MSKELLQLIDLQGEIKIRLIKSGITQDKAHEIAADLLNFIARCPVATEDHRKTYISLGNPFPDLEN